MIWILKDLYNHRMIGLPKSACWLTLFLEIRFLRKEIFPLSTHDQFLQLNFLNKWILQIWWFIWVNIFINIICFYMPIFFMYVGINFLLIFILALDLVLISLALALVSLALIPILASFTLALVLALTLIPILAYLALTLVFTLVLV